MPGLPQSYYKTIWRIIDVDIRPPKRPLGTRPPQMSQRTTADTPQTQQSAAVTPVATPPLNPVNMPTVTSKKKRRLWPWIIGAVLGLILLVGVGSVVWYKLALHPVNSQDTARTRIKIATGDSPAQIGQLLEQKKIIQSSLAFDVYTRLTNTRASLQAGLYSLSPSEPLSTIVDALVAGKVDQFSVTFLPGATVAEDEAVLVKAGYSQSDIDAAFSKQYDHPLFATKPASADLEGYIYGDTYKFDSDATIGQILTRTFDEYYSVVTKHDLINGFQQQGLSLYQGVTLASIVQREVSSSDDQRHVAQIFLKRLQMNMPLGSDVTYHYAAQKMGVAPSPSLDSPYNTRLYSGLPPGPIATPGLTALEAVANPAPGDYLYFLSGDNGTTYYATTEAEHQANIDNYCKVKCATP
jgi:UPF0755 protein